MSRPFQLARLSPPGRRLAIIAALLLCFIRTAAAQETVGKTPPATLELRKPIERSIAGEEVHSYQLSLAFNQFAQLVVDQNGSDVVVIAFGPEGNELFRIDSPNSDRGPEPVALLANSAGTYRIDVKSQTSPAGHYEITLQDLRAATQRDRDRVAAQTLCVEAKALRNKHTEPSYQQAIDKYLAALIIWRSLNDSTMVATTLHEAGLLQGDIGHYQEALDCYSQAQNLYHTLGDLSGEAAILNNTAWVYGELGENQRALALYDQLGEFYKKIGRIDPVVLSNLAASYFKLGQYQRALNMHLQILELRRAARNAVGESITLSNIGSSYYRLGDKTKALDFFGQSLELMLQFKNKYYPATVLNHIGVVYRDLGEYDKALQNFEKALAFREEAGDKRGLAATLADIARLERDRGNFPEARKRIEAALQKVEVVRSRVSSPQLGASFFASVQEYREFYIDLLMRMHPERPAEQLDRAAFNASETGRARSLLQLLSEAGSKIRHGIDPALLERRRMLAESIDEKAQSQMSLLSGKHSAEEATALAKEIMALTTEFEQLEARIRSASPQYAALVKPVPLGVDEIQQKVLDSDTVLLEYSLGDEKSFLWTVTPTSFKTYQLPRREVIETKARRVYELLTARTVNTPNETIEQRNRRIEIADLQFQKASAELSDLILGPAASELHNKRLLIVSDGVLQFIPFSGLPDPGVMVQLRPLILDHEVVMAPSASVVAVLRAETADRKPAPKLLAVLADPVFSANDPRVAMARAKRYTEPEKSIATNLRSGSGSGLDNLRRLRFSRQEADDIARLAGEDSKLEAVDFEANRKLATSNELGQYRVVHFATHGIINNTHPELSGIVLSLVDQTGKAQNGFLRMYDLYNLRLSADLVVLSACQTALGKEVRGEGLVGLTRGFMYAGAPRVIASLWQIDDRASAELMKRFYEGMLGKKLSPAAALRAAQSSMSQDPRWSQPHYWAAFTIQGEWR